MGRRLRVAKKKAQVKWKCAPRCQTFAIFHIRLQHAKVKRLHNSTLLFESVQAWASPVGGGGGGCVIVISSSSLFALLSVRGFSFMCRKCFLSIRVLKPDEQDPCLFDSLIAHPDA